MDDHPQIARRFNAVWSPTLFGFDWDLFRLREVVGYLPVESLLAELLMTRARHALRRSRPDDALGLFDELGHDYSEAAIAAEALYWRGIAAFRLSADKDTLWRVWLRLAQRYPALVWAAKITLLADPGADPDESWRETAAGVRGQGHK